MATKKTRTRTARRTATPPRQKAAPKVAPAADLLDAGEAIELLKTTRPTFYRWLRTGKIKGLKVGRQWRFERAEIDRFLKGEEPRIELRADIGPLVEDVRSRADAIGAPGGEPPDEAPDKPGVQEAVDQIIRLGFGLRASDIHIQPLADEGLTARTAVVRYRVDGVLQQGPSFDIRLLAPLLERWKVFSACDPHQVKRPQDARMIIEAGGVRADLRLCFMPAALGETLTVRILRPDDAVISLDRIDYAPGDRQRLLRALQAPYGLILVTGPAGSGKTTNLYACLSHMAGPAVNTMTVEDPVEMFFPWMVQTGINVAEGLTYERAVRAVLRSDPDVIMIGELRDIETVDLALRAALTGHVVLTTLHSDDAIRALIRLVEVGCPASLVADAVRLAAAQRLVRLLCPKCSRRADPAPKRLARAIELCRAGGIDWDSLPNDFREPVGCNACSGTGYLGRNIIAEVLEVTPEIGAALRRNAPVDEMRAIAVGQGMTTMAADGVRKAAEGKTSLDEVLRVLP
jgi:excisionase family DNA binding protein